MIRVCPSTNPCPEDMLVQYAKDLQSMGVEVLHCDVMDGNFVASKCLPIELISEVSRNTLMALDVHLMISSPLRRVKDFLKLPITYLTVHYEAFENEKDLIRTIDEIHSVGKLAGISVKPNTSIEEIKELLPLVDLVLIMSVEPGKSGQKFIAETLIKIKELSDIKQKNGLNLMIEVDGGINLDNAKLVIDAGAEMLVMGNAFYTAKNKKELLEKVQRLDK